MILLTSIGTLTERLKPHQIYIRANAIVAVEKYTSGRVIVTLDNKAYFCVSEKIDDVLNMIKGAVSK